MIGKRNDLALTHLRFANLKERERPNAMREEIAAGSIDSWPALQSEGKPFSTWRRADVHKFLNKNYEPLRAPAARLDAVPAQIRFSPKILAFS